MKSSRILKTCFTAICFVVLGGILSAAETPAKGIRQIHDFLKAAKCYYIATVDGDQPRVRPFGAVHVYDGRLYLITGKVKPVSHQLAAMLDAYPGLKKMYSPDDDNTMVLYFNGGTAVITSYTKPPVTIRF